MNKVLLLLIFLLLIIYNLKLNKDFFFTPTQMPTTQMPTTQMPTTQMQMPTTQMQMPTTQMPTTQMPTTQMQMPTTQSCANSLCDCGENYCCLGGRSCNITGDETSSVLLKSEDNIIVDPSNENCIDFCVDTYTYTHLDQTEYSDHNTIDKILNGEFKEDKKKSAFFSSKCNQCIKNHYNRLKSIHTGSDKEAEPCVTTTQS
jgi:hypothetical protein